MAPDERRDVARLCAAIRACEDLALERALDAHIAGDGPQRELYSYLHDCLACMRAGIQASLRVADGEDPAAAALSLFAALESGPENGREFVEFSEEIESWGREGGDGS